MDILENKEHWQDTYRNEFLARFEKTGAIDWRAYPHPRNTKSPSGASVDPAASCLMLITSAGGYLPAEQEPFDAEHPLGDYTIRPIPASAPLDALAFAHTHYDHALVDQDAQVLVPLRHLEDLAAAGIIASVSPTAVSFMGYQPDAGRVVDELIPPILDLARDEQADAVLLVPT
jgi:hypothetical protein